MNKDAGGEDLPASSYFQNVKKEHPKMFLPHEVVPFIQRPVCTGDPFSRQTEKSTDDIVSEKTLIALSIQDIMAMDKVLLPKKYRRVKLWKQSEKVKMLETAFPPFKLLQNC